MHLNLKKTMLISSLLIFFQISNAFPVKPQNNDTAIQNEILLHINQYRKQKGLIPLIMDNRMVKEAKQHSEDMAQHKISFGHLYFMQRMHRLHTQIKDSGAGAENVAYNYKTAQEVVRNWLRSPGHKANIDGHFNLTGIGIAHDKQGKIYFTQIFLQQGKNTQYAHHRPFFRFF